MGSSSETRPPGSRPHAEVEKTATRGSEIQAGLCALCAHMRTAVSRQSVYLRCALAGRDERFPRYPRLPVVSCSGFERLKPTD